MIIAYVHIPHGGPKRDRETAVAASVESTKIYREVKGLHRKYYLNGDEAGGGVYVFDTRENAEAWFHDGWAEWMEGRFGVRPSLTLFDSHVVLDNNTGEVRVDGTAIPAPWAAVPA